MNFSVTCFKCGSKLRGNFNSPATFICQKCGEESGIIEFPEGVNANSVRFECVKCEKQFVLKIESPSHLKCNNLKCAWTIIKPLGYMTLSKVINFEDTEVEYKYSPPKYKPLLPHIPDRESSSRVKLVIPYFKGGKRIDRAINTWIKPEVVFGIVDQGILPPGFGICGQIFSTKTAISEAVSNNPRPFVLDLISKLVQAYPDEDYYGYTNSDTILPPGSTVKSLLPRRNKRIVFHHRLELKGEDDAHISKLIRGGQIYCGKDLFLAHRDVIKDILIGMKDLILGGASWDDGICTWCFLKYGVDAVDLRYGEIYHATHKQNWSGDDPESKYNSKALIESGVKDSYRHSINWFNMMREEVPEDEKKYIRKLGIIQPGRIGDIIIVLPIAKWYYDSGYHVVWPVAKEYVPMFNYVNYVEALDIGPGVHDSYNRSKQALMDKDITDVLDLGIGFGRDESDWSQKVGFDRWKYETANVPFEERFNLIINRNFDKEIELEKTLGLTGKNGYIVTHSTGSYCSHNFNQEGSVEIREIPGFTVFDWIGIIEKAKHVYCVDSCIAHMVSQLNLAVGKRTFQLLPSKYPPNRRGNKPDGIDWEESKKSSIQKKSLIGLSTFSRLSSTVSRS